MVLKDRHVGAVAAELLAAFEFSGGQDSGEHACYDVEGGWAALKY